MNLPLSEELYLRGGVQDPITLRDDVAEWCMENIHHGWKVLLIPESREVFPPVMFKYTCDGKEHEYNFTNNIAIFHRTIIIEDDTEGLMFKMRWL